MRTKAAKWKRWHVAIGEELRRLRGWRREWLSLVMSADVGGARRAFVDEVYAHALAMGIRRQLKTGSRDLSMVRLLADIAVSRGHTVGSGRVPIDSTAVRADLSGLKRVARAAEAFADRSVAHADRRGHDDLPLDALHEALDRLVSLHAEYAARLDP
jgi:hypothetical protein